jgi:hypothetical protein
MRSRRLARTARPALLIPLSLFVLALMPGDAAAVVKRTVRANLDGDARRERVQLIAATRANPFGGTAPLPVAYVRVVDRDRGRLIKRRITPRRVERARFRIRDVNRDGRREAWFNGVQGMGFFHFGLYGWTGAGRRVLWYWNSARSAVGRRGAGARAQLEDRDPSYPGREIVLIEGVLSPGDARCCPSRLLVQVFGQPEVGRRYRLIDDYYVPGPSPSGAARYPAKAAWVRDCHTYAYYPNVLISSARNMSCRAARREMRRYRRPIRRRFRTPSGFRCYRASGGRFGGQWRCVKGARAFRFEFGD